MPSSAHLCSYNPQKVLPYHHISSSVPRQTIHFQTDSFLTLPPHAALCPRAWTCFPLQLSFYISCQAVPPHIFTLSSPCLGSGTLYWVTPSHRRSPHHFIWVLTPTSGCPSTWTQLLSWLVSDISAGQVSQMDPLFSFLDSSTMLWTTTFPSPSLWRRQPCSAPSNDFRTDYSGREEEEEKIG